MQKTAVHNWAALRRAAGARAAITKLAGTVDDVALDRFVSALRHGDIINFSANSGDVFESDLVRGAKHLAISEPIRAVTGGTEHHTAMYAGRHPKTGVPMIMHNFEQGGAGIQYEPLTDYADRTNFRAYRVPGTSDKDAAKALGKVFALKRQGNTTYPTHNAIAAGLPAVAQRVAASGTVPGAAAAAGLNLGSAILGRDCPPGTSFCSTLPAQAYGDVIGRDRAFEAFAGEKVPRYREQWTVNPMTISRNLPTVGSRYQPANSAGGGALGTLRGVGRNLLRLLKR